MSTRVRTIGDRKGRETPYRGWKPSLAGALQNRPAHTWEAVGTYVVQAQSEFLAILAQMINLDLQDE